MIVVDLTHDIEPDMITFGADWHPKVAVTQMGRHETVGRETRCLTLGSHTGTHIDAPLHFQPSGCSIDAVPLDTLVGPVTILDFSHLSPRAVVEASDLPEVIPARVVFRFGWGVHWNTPQFYEDYPSISGDAADALVAAGVKLVGMDTPSPDASGLTAGLLGTPSDSPIHKSFLRRGVILAEYLANLEHLETLEGWSIIALPLRLKGGDGAPARICLARFEESDGDPQDD